MKDNTWGRVINPNRNRPGRERDASGAWHWMAMERSGYAITFCLLFAPIEKLVLRGGFDGHVQHRCLICQQAWLHLLGLDGKSVKDLMYHENGWNMLPRFDGHQAATPVPFSRQIKEAAKKVEGQKRTASGIQRKLPKLRKTLQSNVLPVLVEYHDEQEEFYAHCPVVSEVTIFAPDVSTVLADMGRALEDLLCSDPEEQGHEGHCSARS